jgi:hypothetical protein
MEGEENESMKIKELKLKKEIDKAIVTTKGKVLCFVFMDFSDMGCLQNLKIVKQKNSLYPIENLEQKKL